MNRYKNTAARLAAWRAYPYREGKALPNNWFDMAHECSVTKDDRGMRYHFGDGIGGKEERNIPFRFIGYSHDVANLRHTGWYADNDQYDLYRGIVVQLPSRNGETQYLAGMVWGENGKTFAMGGGYLDIGRNSIYSTKEDAARAADDIARIDADNAMEEREREEEETREREEEEEREEANAIADDLDAE